MKLSFKQLIAKLPLPFWVSFYIFLILIAVPTLAYIGTFGKAAPGSLTVTIDQKTGTNDPNPSYTSVFTVQFNEAIDEATFTDSDITLGGTASGQAVQSITEAGTFNKTTYEVRIQATGAGTITPTIAQELITAQNGASGTNQASTSTDNTVTYNGDWAPGEFVTTWKTDNPGVSGPNQITIPTNGGGYNYNVDWGDGNTSTGLTGNSTHTYASTGTYTVSITGTFPRIAFNNNGDRQKILTVEQWSTNAWASMEYAFMGCANLSINAVDAPDFSLLTSLDSMFTNSTNLNSNLNHWDVSHITNMQSVFQGASSFNQPLNNWDVSGVTNMTYILSGASTFNQPLYNWDVGNVANMWGMFYNATSFNQPLDNWNTSSVTNMGLMFRGAISFNQTLNNWDTSYVTNMGSMFYGASAFNQPLNDWNTSGITNLGFMFQNATSFNQSIDSWDVSHVTNADSMFSGASAFNQSLSDWDTSNMTFMYGMFKNASSFNQSLATWDVSNVTGTTGMYDMLNYTALSVANYDATLIGWSSQNLKNGVYLNAFSRKYCTSAVERQSIITNHSWAITDGGTDCASTRAPQVDTNSATGITQNSATLNGVTSPDTITARGFQYGTTNSYGSTATDSSATITTYGSQGSGNGQFGFAYGVATDSSGNVYVADSANHRIQKFDANGNFLMKFGTNGSGNGQLNAPDDVSIDSSGNIYVADSLNHRIQKFNSSGTYLSQFGTNGSGNGQFNTPASITFDTSGNIYVADQDNHRIQKFDSSGTYLSQFGTNGSGNGQFANPHGVTVDASGNIYVADTSNHRIQKFDSNGAYITKWGSAGSGNGQFNHPSNTAIDKDGNVYVMDFLNHRVQKFSNNGFYISQFGSGGPGLTEFTFPHDLAFSPNGNLYIQDNLGYRLKRYVGTITTNISGLTCGTTYHYRAYATNSYGTGYGDDQTFATSACPQDPFIMTVKTDNPGVSGNNQYTIPTNNGNYTYNYNVDCNNDGTNEFTNQTSDVTCTYGSIGSYDIAITGIFPHLKNNINTVTDTDKITDVKQWGDIEWQDMSDMFLSATNITTFTATDIPDLSNVTDMSWMFIGATNFNSNINNWDTSSVADMSGMFIEATNFNQPLNNWDVSNAVDMSSMFSSATNFNQPLNNWDTSNVVDMRFMFHVATNFNSNINNWDTSSVSDMGYMFHTATNFNSNINNWDTSSVADMTHMFSGATNFNQPLNNWNVSNAVDMSSMFESAASFNQPLNDWDTSNVANLSDMFFSATNFNSNINNWDTSSVADMSGMFVRSLSFNQPLNNWDTSNVTNMSGMFSNATNFNQPLNNWDTSSVADMSGMFVMSLSFNQPLNNWDTSNVANMNGMFSSATSINQSLASWDVSNVASMSGMFSNFIEAYKVYFEQIVYVKPYDQWTQQEKDDFFTAFSNMTGVAITEVNYQTFNSGLSTPNYDATLISWSAQNLESSVTFDAGTSKYCNAEVQRQSIITNKSWTINDAGKGCAFIMRVKTDNPGVSSNNQYTIPTHIGGTYNYNVDCGNDGSVEHANQTGSTTCTFGSPGSYDIAITGIFPHMLQSSAGDQQKITDIIQWGDIAWQSTESMFAEATNITTFSATDTPDLSNVTDMAHMFHGASSFNQSLNNWDVSNVVDMSYMFESATNFNQPLNNWNVSNVTDITHMFFGATTFNANISNWNVSNVTDMSGVFFDASSFNQPLNNWNVSNVTDMGFMFTFATSFNQPLNNWDVGNVVEMQEMFVGATSFNQPLNNWNVSNVTDMSGMFGLATSFNQPLNNWNVSNVTDMSGMFGLATSFNQPFNNWNVGNVVMLDYMFLSATSFNQSLASWDVSNAVSMKYMFGDFVQSQISFYEQLYDRPYTQWTQQEKDDFWAMVSQTLGYPVGESYTPNPSGLSTPNYDATLIAWSAQNLESSVTFDAGTSKYCNAEVQRQSIITSKSWTINDAGKQCPATAPTAPLNPTITEVTTTSMQFNWQPPANDGNSPITSYQVQYKASSSSTWINAPAQGPSPTTHVLTNLSPGTSYDLRVLAINAMGSSSYTNPITGTTMAEPILPNEPPPPPSPEDPDPPVDPPVLDPETPTTNEDTNTPEPGTPIYSPQSTSRPKREKPLSILGFIQKTFDVKAIVSYAEYTPRPIARATPYSILSLLIAIALFYGYSSYMETKRRRSIQALITRFKSMLSARATYLRITSHYISTPITKMQGTIELLSMGVTSGTPTGSISSNNNSTTTTNSGSSTNPTANANVHSGPNSNNPTTSSNTNSTAITNSSSNTPTSNDSANTPKAGTTISPTNPTTISPTNSATSSIANTNPTTSSTTNPSSSSNNSSSSNQSASTNSANSNQPLPPPVALAASVTTLTIPENSIVAAKAGLKNLSNHSNELLAEGQSLTGAQQANIRNLEKQKGLSFLTNPNFWLPVVVISTLVVLLNFIFIQANRYTPTAITILSQLLLGFVGVIALGVSYYFYRQQKATIALLQTEQTIEQEFNTRQANFITEASNKLNDDLLLLEGISKDIAKYPKVSGFTDGLKDLKQIVAQLDKLSQLSKYVPGLNWSTNLSQTIANTTKDLDSLANKQSITITTNNLQPNTLVAVESSALSHLIAAPLKNAIQASPAGNQVTITQTTNQKDKQHPITITITDQGQGIPAEKLNDIFTPFNSAHSLERFNDTGLGLDLYLAKVVAEAYGANINLTSQEGEGTTTTIGLDRAE